MGENESLPQRDPPARDACLEGVGEAGRPGLNAGLSRLSSLSDASPREIASLLPNHSLIKPIGSGGYGEVWLARRRSGGFVAIKFLFQERFEDPDPYEREFRGIRRFMAMVASHPGWVNVLHLGREDAAACFHYVMELADDAAAGPAASRLNPRRYVPKTLKAVLAQREQLPPVECLDLAISLGGALAHLHGQGLVHRDIKPSNVLFVGGLPRFADLGLITTQRRCGEPQSGLGTRGYVAPEGPGTERADIYGLGKLLYVCFTGKDVHAFPEARAGLFSGPRVPLLAELNELILRACDPDPRQRFPSASDLVRTLERLRSVRTGGRSVQVRVRLKGGPGVEISGADRPRRSGVPRSRRSVRSPG